MKILIYGWKISDWSKSKTSAHALGYNLYLAFKRTSHTIYYCHKDDEDLPSVDIVVLVTYRHDGVDVGLVKQKTGAVKTCSVREVHLDCDFSFLFNPEHFTNSETCMVLGPPCNKELLYPTVKEENSVLIDHYWIDDYFGVHDRNDKRDWTFKIEAWVERVKKGNVYRMLRFPNEKNDMLQYQKPIEYTDYLDYLAKTSGIETFVITHRECYTYGVIDMAARGTRIISPEGFLPRCLVDVFGIEEFTDENTFVELLNDEIDVNQLKENVNKCMSFDDIVLIMLKKFEEWV